MVGLGLPDDVRACLFDLDGVLTSTADVHAAAWKRDVRRLPPRAGGRERASPSSRSTSSPTTSATSTASPATTAPATFLAVPGDHPPRGPTDDPPDAETVSGLGNRKNDARPAPDPGAAGCEAYPGSVRYLRRGPGGRPGAGRWCRPAPTAATSCVAAGLDRPGRRVHRRDRGRAATGCGASPRPTRSWPGPSWLGVAPAHGGGVRGRPGRGGGGPGRRVRLRGRRRPGGPGRRAAAPTGPTSWSTTSSELFGAARDHRTGLRGRAVVRAGDRARPRAPQPERVGVRPVQRPHRAAGQPRRGRAATACPAPTSTASTSCGRCPTPRPATATPSRARR